MKKHLILLAALALILAACSSRAPETQRDSRLIRRPAQPTLQDRLEARGFRFGAPAFIRIFKKEEVLEVWLQKDNGEYALFLDYPICIYSGELGPKTREGDKQSPEGFYAVGREALNPNSQYHLSFNLGYPNAYDRAHGYSGSMLMVHGKCVSIGCYAMGDRQIEEIYTLVGSALQRGQPFVRVHAFPFRMTDANLAAYSDHRWYDFWQMLKPGYDYFERYHQPPEIDVIGGQYALSDRNPHPAPRPGSLPPARSTPVIPGENLNANPFTGGTAIAQNHGDQPLLNRPGTNPLLGATRAPLASTTTLPAPAPLTANATNSNAWQTAAGATTPTLDNAFQSAATNSPLPASAPLTASTASGNAWQTAAGATTPTLDNAFQSAAANSPLPASAPLTASATSDNAWQTAASGSRPSLSSTAPAVAAARLGLPATAPLTLTSDDNSAPPSPAPATIPAATAPVAPPYDDEEPMPVLRGNSQPPLDLTSYGTPPVPVN